MSVRRTVPLAFGALTTVLPTATLVTAGAGAATRVSPRTYVGKAESTRYGPVQVTIYVSGRRMTSIGASVPTQAKRSAQINQHAVVVLQREALQAQSANIHVVSGATITSRAYEGSLASALRAAHL